MLVGGDYITTYLNGELRFDKPILIYWLQLISIKFFGIDEFAFRLPSALASLIWSFSIFWFTNRFFGLRRAFFASFFMLTILQINIISKASIADALLNMFISLSMFSIYIYYSNNRKKYLYLAFLSIALGTLTKGPVAIMIPLVVTLIFYIIDGKFRDWLKMIFDPIGVLLFFSIALPWYIAEYMAQGDAFIDGFFIKHNIGRFSSAMEKHGGGIFYFIPVLLVGFLPFTSFIFNIFSDIKSIIKDKLKLYLIVWFSFVFIFFSFSGTKLPHYIIYGYTPLFILGSLYIDKYNKNLIVYPTLVLLSILILLPDIANIIKKSIDDRFIALIIEDSYDIFDIWYRISILFLIGLITFSKRLNSDIFLILSGFIMVFLVNFIAIPTYGELMQEPIKNGGLLARNRGYQVVMYRVNVPSFNVYYGGVVLKRKPRSGDIVFTKFTKLEDFKEYKILYRDGGFVLIELY